MSQTAVQGDTAMLDCPVHGNPPPALRWLRDGRPLLLRSLRLTTFHNGSLALHSVTVRPCITATPPPAPLQGPPVPTVDVTLRA